MKSIDLKAWTVLTILLLACLLAYGNIFEQDFVYDDRELVTDNPSITQLSRIPGLFATHYWTGSRLRSNLYRPVVTTSLAINYALGSLDPKIYKVTNFILHLLCCWVLYLFGRQAGLSFQSGLGASLLFAVHPLHTEAVTSIVGRTELFWTLFGLLALLLWMKAHEHPQVSGKGVLRTRPYRLALLCILLALLSKESALLFPVFLLFADAHRIHLASGRDYRRALKQALADGLRGPYWGVVGLFAVYGLIRWQVLGFVGLGGAALIPRLDNPLAHAGSMERIIAGLAIFARYIWQHLWPFALSADYSYRQIPIPDSPYSPGVLAGLALSLVFLMSTFRFRSAMGRYTMPFWIWLFPLFAASNILTPLTTVYAERLTYFPSAGFVLVLALSASDLLPRLASFRFRRIITRSLIPVLVSLAFLTYTRNKIWSNEGIFFKAMVRDAPLSAKAHHNWGDFLLETDHLDAAEKEFQQALAIMPDLAATHVDLGLVREKKSQPEAAVAQYRLAIRLDPGLAEAYNNLGRILKQQGLGSESLAAYEAAIQAAPDHFRARFNLANTYAAGGHLEDAVRQYRAAITLNPIHAPSYFNLANTLAQLGRKTEARQAYQRFLKIWRGDALQLKRAREAIQRLK